MAQPQEVLDLPKPTIIVNPEHQITPIIADFSHNMIVLSSDFQNHITRMPEVVATAKKALGLDDDTALDVDTIDEKDLETKLAALTESLEIKRQYENTTEQVKRQLRAFTANFTGALNELATNAGFSDIELLYNEGRKTETEILNKRLKRNWFAAFDIYSNALTTNPNIATLFPALVTQAGFEKLITSNNLIKMSGAKSFTITANHRQTIVNLVASLSALTEAAIVELNQLPVETHASILMALTADPSMETLYKQVHFTKDSLQAKAKAAEQALLAEQAKAKAAEQAKAQNNANTTSNVLTPAQSKNPGQAPAQAIPNQPQLPEITLSVPLNDPSLTFFMDIRNWLIKSYIPSKGNQFYDVFTNSASKLKLIQHVALELQNPESEFGNIVQGNAEASLTILLVVQSL